VKHIGYSIIIPTHNSSSYIEPLLLSIPDRNDTEVIVIDDHSSADELSLTRDLLLKRCFPNAVILSNSGKRGAGAARNVGIDEASGDWLLFADSDDIFTSRLSAALDTYLDSKSDLVMFRPMTQANSLHATRTQEYESTYDRGILEEVGYSIAPMISKLFRHSMIIENGIRCSETLLSNDYMFSVTAFAHAHNPTIDNIPIYERVVRQNSLFNHTHSLDELMIRAEIQVEVRDFLCARLQKETLRRVTPFTGPYLKAALNVAGPIGVWRLRKIYAGHGLPIMRNPSIKKYLRRILRINKRNPLSGGISPESGEN
jgi:glycosyltransferase involved in cell wall biosynthesis